MSGVQVGLLANVAAERVEEVGVALVQPVAGAVNGEAERNADERDLLDRKSVV